MSTFGSDTASQADSIEFPCTSCGRMLKVAASAAGRRAACPQCNAVVLVPAGDTRTAGRGRRTTNGASRRPAATPNVAVPANANQRPTAADIRPSPRAATDESSTTAAATNAGRDARGARNPHAATLRASDEGDRQDLRRAGRARARHACRALLQRARADRKRAGSRQNALRADARQSAGLQVRPHSVHRRLDAIGRDRRPDPRYENAGLPLPPRPDLHAVAAWPTKSIVPRPRLMPPCSKSCRNIA